MAEAVIGRTGCQPFLTQLYGGLLVNRLNDNGRKQAEVADVSVVEEDVVGRGDSVHYFRNTFNDAPDPVRAALTGLATEGCAEMDTRTRRWLSQRCLIVSGVWPPRF